MYDLAQFSGSGFGSTRKRDGEEKGGSFSRFGFDPNLAAAAFDTSLANRKPHAGTRIVRLFVEATEDSENLLVELPRNADAIIPYRKYPLLAMPSRSDLYLWGFGAAITYRVSNQVLKNLFQLKRRHPDVWKT